MFVFGPRIPPKKKQVFGKISPQIHETQTRRFVEFLRLNRTQETCGHRDTLGLNHQGGPIPRCPRIPKVSPGDPGENVALVHQSANIDRISFINSWFHGLGYVPRVCSSFLSDFTQTCSELLLFALPLSWVQNSHG